MNRILWMMLAASAWSLVAANGSNALELTGVELAQLGIELARPDLTQQIEIASAPAEVVIPPTGQAIVSTTVSGVLSRLLVAEGDTVEAGQPLAEIQSAELLALQKDFVDAAAADDLAQAQLERDRGLHVDGIIAERRLQESVVTARAAETALDQARQQLLIAGMPAPSIARLADTGALSATLPLRAPFRSVVVGRLRAVGAHVDALEPLFSVADLGTLWLEAHVPQERAEQIEPGMWIAVTAAGEDLAAEITHIGRVVDPVTQTVLIRGVVENRGSRLRAGQVLTARVLHDASGQTPVLAVPNAAVVRGQGAPVVFVRTEEGIAAQPIEILAEDGARVYLRAGLDHGAEVAVAGIAALKSIWLGEQEGGE